MRSQLDPKNKRGLKNVQPKHNCWRCLTAMAERSMVNVRLQSTADDTFWECKNRESCDKRKAKIGKSHQVAVYIEFSDNGRNVVEEFKAWTTKTPGLVAWKHNDQWELVHQTSGHFIENFAKREWIDEVAEQLACVTDWTKPIGFVATRDVMNRTGEIVRAFYRRMLEPDNGTAGEGKDCRVP